MTMQTRVDAPATPTAHPDVALSGAWELYTTAAEIFTVLLREVREEHKDNAREVMTYARDLKDALKLVLNERAAIDKLRKDYGGIGDGPGLDFDAARAEIGRRLACLRDAGGGG
ncbi:MAG: hypothetical protein ACK4TB_05295 [Gemmobacter sp.]